MERRHYDPEVWEPWSDAFDDGDSNLRRIEILYHSSIAVAAEADGQEIAVRGHRGGGSNLDEREESTSKDMSDPNQQPQTSLDSSSLPPPGSDDFETSLAQAAFNGHEAVVKQLLERERADVELTMDSREREALWLTRGTGLADVVDLLVKVYHKGADPNSADSRGTHHCHWPLNWAMCLW